MNSSIEHKGPVAERPVTKRSVSERSVTERSVTERRCKGRVAAGEDAAQGGPSLWELLPLTYFWKLHQKFTTTSPLLHQLVTSKFCFWHWLSLSLLLSGH